MRKEIFTVHQKIAALYPAKQPGLPLIVLNTFAGNGDAVMQALSDLHAPACHLLTIGNLDWNHDLTPWACAPLSKKDAPFSGAADDYLQMLCAEIIPHAGSLCGGTPAYLGIAGYSLAGLFALYALCQCDLFRCAASVSGSLWYPQFAAFVQSHPMQNLPRKIYLSLGDLEAKTKHPLLKTVREQTDAVCAHYQQLGIRVQFELNPGNHFQDDVLRTAKGIAAICGEQSA